MRLPGVYTSYAQCDFELNSALLPSTNQTDTVTIQDGRAATFGNYAEVIVSTQPINAPDAFAPVG